LLAVDGILKARLDAVGFPIGPVTSVIWGVLLRGRYCVSKPDVKFSQRGFPVESLHLQEARKGNFTSVKKLLDY